MTKPKKSQGSALFGIIGILLMVWGLSIIFASLAGTLLGALGLGGLEFLGVSILALIIGIILTVFGSKLWLENQTTLITWIIAIVGFVLILTAVILFFAAPEGVIPEIILASLGLSLFAYATGINALGPLAEGVNIYKGFIGISSN